MTEDAVHTVSPVAQLAWQAIDYRQLLVRATMDWIAHTFALPCLALPCLT